MSSSFVSFSRVALVLASASFLSVRQLPAQTASSSSALTKEQILKQLDPDMAEVITLYNDIKGTPITKLTPQDARQQFSPEDAAKIEARFFNLAERPKRVGQVQDGLAIDGPDGNQIPIRIYTPEGSGPFPVILYFHGGGFVIATIDTYDASARALCDDTNAIVVSVEYRKAPEHPFPAARRDAIASYKWVIASIANYNGIASKIALAGESAGGNLATEVAIAARNEGLQKPTHELLVYPVTSSNLHQPSDLKFTSPFLPLNTAGLAYFFANYVTDPAEGKDPHVAPILANVKDLPPTTIIAAEFDPLVSDGQAYAAKLQAAGVPVVYRLYTGTTHEFFGLGAEVSKAREAERFAAARLAASFQ